MNDVASLLLATGSEAYRRATSPRNATAVQTPAAVARVRGPEDVAACLRWARERDLTVQVQATGHGAAGPTGPGTIIVDTSALDDVGVDPVARTARVGTGASWFQVNAAAAVHGLIGPSGTAPSVGAAGYLFHGGIGWTTRPHGLASAALREVDFVDAAGDIRRVGPDSEPEALWAFRGGGGVGIATTVEIDLRSAGDLWAGYLLWPAEHLAAVASAWGDALDRLHPALSTSLAVLREAPGGPHVPAALRGTPVVHLAAASVDGVDAAAELQELLAALPRPAVDTLGPCSAERLAGIHLDPPVAVPAVGDGRWLNTIDGADTTAILEAAGFPFDAALAEVELRHMPAPPVHPVPGALTSPPGAVVLHAVGAAADPAGLAAVENALERVRRASRHVDAGRSAASFRDGRSTAPGALTEPHRRRLRAIRRVVDPDGLVVVPRPLDLEPAAVARPR